MLNMNLITILRCNNKCLRPNNAISLARVMVLYLSRVGFVSNNYKCRSISNCILSVVFLLILFPITIDAGEEDTVSYVDVISGSICKTNLNSYNLYAAEVSRYWSFDDPKFENHFVGFGTGFEVHENAMKFNALAKYSYLGMVGIEAGPRIWNSDVGGLVRIWTGIFAIGVQAEYSNSIGSVGRFGIGVFGAFPIGEKRNGKYRFLPMNSLLN